jgi:hypothetical protein
MGATLHACQEKDVKASGRASPDGLRWGFHWWFQLFQTSNVFKSLPNHPLNEIMV